MNEQTTTQSAAPELLDALKELLDREWQDDEGDYTLEMARRKARAAIAKAEGGKMRAHTPGPWKKSERLNGPWWHISSGHSIDGQECGSGRQAIACVHGESKRSAKAYAEMFEANARLIAAAPDLLDFAQEWLERQGTDENYMTAKARAAIAKATQS